MRRWMIVLVLGTLLLSIGFVNAQDDIVTVDPSTVMQVVDSTPLSGEEVSLNTPVTLYFDRLLNCETVNVDVVQFDQVAVNDVSCNDNVVTITPPATGYAPATTYTVTVSDDLRGSNGERLFQPYELQFNTTGFLQVTEVLPAPGTADVAGDAVITVIFSRPVVPLGTTEDMAALPDPLNFTPSTAGRGEWINTSIYTFTPDPAWAGGTTYNVTVDPTLVAVDGATLAGGSGWTFTTASPEVTGVIPEDAAGNVKLDESIQVTFNQPMDQASVENAFQLLPLGGAQIPGEFEWADDAAGLRFTPDELLLLNTAYQVVIGDRAQGLAGGNLRTAVTTSLSTVPAPAIIGSDPFDGQVDVQPFGGVTLYFASPMDMDTLNDKITIEPEPWREPDFFYQNYNDSLQVSFPTEPSTEYTVTVAPGMLDDYGNRIDTGFSFSYTTAPFQPDLNLQVPGPVGFYNGNRDETQVFVTHRNVSRLDLSLYSVNLADFVRQVSDDSYYDPTEGYTPSGVNQLRSWQIDSVAPQNARRYELLSLGSVGADGVSGTAVVCPDALPTRVKVGDTGIVISDPDPLRARSSAPDGDIVELLYRDYVFAIIGGPVCDDGILWWEIRLRDERTAWVAEGVGEEYFFDLRAESQSTDVIIPEVFTEGDSLAPGIYYLEVNSPETAALGYRPARHFLVVGTANLTTYTSVEGMTVWATDVNTGQPIPDAPIQIVDGAFNVVAQAMTDSDGIARLNDIKVSDLYVQQAVILQTDAHFGVGVTAWTEGIDPWRFGLPSEYYPRGFSLYMYTDRPIYRPDQPVYFRGVLRQKNDVSYTQAEINIVTAQIFDNQGELIYEKALPLTEFGTFSDTFMLADDAPLGFYRVVVDLPSSQQFQSEGGSVAFNVAEYRLPEFQVELLPEQTEVVQGDTISVNLDSTYFFGGAVQNADVEYNVIANPYNFDYTGPGTGYSFADFDADGGPAEFYSFNGGVIASGSGVTDAAGDFSFEVPADLEDATQSQQFTIEAVVTDESDQAVAGRTSVVVHQGNLYIGARPREYVGTALSDTFIDIIAVGWDSLPVADQTIAIEAVERRWSSVQEEDPNGRTTWSWEVEEISVLATEVTTDADGRAEFAFIPPNGGIFKIAITTMDADGNEIRAATTMWVSDQQYISWRQQNSNRIDLIADADSYDIGDTAEILITSPFQGATEALIVVQRGDVLSAERVTMESNSYVHEITIAEDFAPNVYVSAMLVKGVDESNPIAGFRMGVVQLNVDRSRKEIDILVTPDRDTAGPRDTVTYTVQTADWQGNPVVAEVGIGLTDLASLSIGDPNSIPIVDFFYGLQGISVRTASVLTINTDQITQTVLDTIKGGGGGFGEGGIFDIREDFVDTAYWNASVITDENGLATFEVTLPDNLTTWRLDARAVTRGDNGLTLVGQDTFDLLSTKPLLIRPVTPRFFVVGDEVILGAVINNNTDDAVAVEVALQGSGLIFSDDAAQSLVIPANGGLRVNWLVTVDNVETVDLTFFVRQEDGDLSDASKPPLGQGEDRLLPVYRYEAPEITGTGGVIRDGDTITEGIVLPQRFDVTEGELTVSLQPSLAATTLDSLEVLRGYSYQGIESVVSRFLPNIMTIRALDEFGQVDQALRDSLAFEVQLAVQRLYAQQKVDGGWGWYVQDESNILVTAWALIGLTEARNEGFAVDAAVIARAQDFLRGGLISPGLNVEAWRLDRQVFLLYALARSGSADVGRTVALYDSRDRLSIYAKALLASTLDTIGGDNGNRVNTLLSDISNDSILSANGIHWEEAERDYWNWNTDTRTTAIVLQTLVQLNPNSDLIPGTVRWLMVARTADIWETTQETAWVLLALADWMRTSGELNADYDFSVSFNGSALAESTVSPASIRDTETLLIDVNDMLQDQINALTLARTSGAGNLYYTAYLRALLPVPQIEPLNRGVIIERRYTLLDDPDNTTISEARVGDLVQVRLTVIAPNDLHYVVIEDPIPAGSDAVNPNLTTSQQIGTRPGLDTDDPISRGWGWWWFSNIEFRDEKVVLNSTYLPAGTYEYVYTIRPGLAGTYNVIPATGREFFFPDVFGRSAGSTFTILPAE